jgi:uncharacterized protein YqhQ
MSEEEQEQIDAEKPKLFRLGGMALPNGLLIQGPTHWAAAVRDSNGKIEVASARRPRLAPDLVDRLPFLRGPVKIAEAMIVPPMVRLRLRSARLPFESWRTVAAIVGTLGATSLLRRHLKSPALRETAAQALGFLPAVVALRDRDLAAYHGAEHKVIAAYEQAIDDPALVPKEHDRCGSNLLPPVTLFSIAGTFLAERLLEDPGPFARSVVSLGGVAAAVEMFAWSDRNHGTPLAEAFHTPGREIQRRFATEEPTPEQLEVAVAALTEALRVEDADESAGDEPLLAT